MDDKITAPLIWKCPSCKENGHIFRSTEKVCRARFRTFSRHENYIVRGITFTCLGRACNSHMRLNHEICQSPTDQREVI